MTQIPLDAGGCNSGQGSTTTSTTSTTSNQNVPSNCDGPPAYESSEAVTSAQTSINKPEGSNDSPASPSSSSSRTNRPSSPKAGRLTLRIVPDLHSTKPSLWFGDLYVECADLPRLMREGFFWSAESVIPEESFMSYSTRRDLSVMGYKVSRVWNLVDRRNGENPLWKAQLDVAFFDVAHLSAFRIQDPSVENVSMARAWNEDRQVVFNFEYDEPEQCFNCIYDDMPLQGWWPCPKPRQHGRTARRN